MVEVTAEMIERGRGGDPRVAAERRRMALKVREAREKLTASGSAPRAGERELLRLYAERRRASLPVVLALDIAVALVAALHVSMAVAAVWLALRAGIACVIHVHAARFLASKAEVPLATWRRRLVTAEALHGAMWTVIALAFGGFVGAPVAMPAATFALVAMLLAAAMSATTAAALPGAVTATLAPTALALVALARPSHVGDGKALVLALAVGALLYFVHLARELHGSAVRDLSFQADRDALIAELEQSRTNSDLARLRAEESNQAKSKFLATMSHELRTPLNAILGFSEMMKGEIFGPLSVPAYKDYVGDIHASGQHLLMLINEILDLSRVEAGRYELHEEPVDLAGIIDECRHLVELRAKKKDIAIRQDGGAMLPRLWADARAVRQVALNLLSNAIKFTPQGGEVTISLGAGADGGQYFCVRDTGTGIPEAEIPIIMSSFGRGSLAHKNAEEGTGLGLPIVKGLVELHGGSFDLTSKVREGTIVTVRFPPERVMEVLERIDIEGEVEAMRTAA